MPMPRKHKGALIVAVIAGGIVSGMAAYLVGSVIPFATYGLGFVVGMGVPPGDGDNE